MVKVTFKNMVALRQYNLDQDCLVFFCHKAQLTIHETKGKYVKLITTDTDFIEYKDIENIKSIEHVKPTDI